MGLEAAKCMPMDHALVISGRTREKLQKAAEELASSGHEVFVAGCDISNRESVQKLAAYAASLGTITNVINAAGVSPQMAQEEQLLRINALGTVYVNEEFSRYMEKGSVILDVSSNSAYALPALMRNLKSFAFADQDEEKFLHKMIALSHLTRDSYKRRGFAYALSKSFVIWYSRRCAYQLGTRGIRVLSLSTGLIATDMGDLEKEEGKLMIERSAEHRMGIPSELGYSIATAADERNGYLAGVDILVDGGATGRNSHC